MDKEKRLRFSIELQKLMRKYGITTLQGWKFTGDDAGRIEAYDANDNGIFTIFGSIHATENKHWRIEEYER